VARNEGHFVVEKVGEARGVAEQLADGSGDLAAPRGEG
jgi:hypothetical protein